MVRHGFTLLCLFGCILTSWCFLVDWTCKVLRPWFSTILVYTSRIVLVLSCAKSVQNSSRADQVLPHLWLVLSHNSCLSVCVRFAKICCCCMESIFLANTSNVIGTTFSSVYPLLFITSLYKVILNRKQEGKMKWKSLQAILLFAGSCYIIIIWDVPSIKTTSFTTYSFHSIECFQPQISLVFTLAALEKGITTILSPATPEKQFKITSWCGWYL